MKKTTLSLLFMFATAMATAQPKLEWVNDSTAHIVANGQPMLMIGGEMGNSSASNKQDIQRHYRHLHNLGLNTVLTPVSWELIEPEEGKFDLSSVETILETAKSEDLKVVLLWFGAWKNSMSCYAPEWFKRDTKRFPRAHDMNGKPIEEASSLSQNVLEADKRAFCQLMQYLRDNDKDQTVLMIQVENEIGMVEVPRDYSADATKLYNSPVPESLTNYLNKHRKSLHPYLQERYQPNAKDKSWAGMFGNDLYAEEIFQTWTYARYTQQIAEAGRKIYNLPMYVNAALNSRGRKPGQYPSGGPLDHLIDIWHAEAPAIDVLGIDLYDKGFADWIQKYHRPNNPLFIPEIRLEDKDAMYVLYAIGHHDAMGFCPFSIEDYPLYANGKNEDMSSMDLSKDDQLNAYSNKAKGSRSQLSACYQLLRKAEPLILQRQGTADIEGILLTNENREQDIITPDGIRLTIKYSYSLGWEPGAKESTWPEAACLILRLGKEDYMVIGSNVVITYTDAKCGKNWQSGDPRIGLALCEDTEANRRLNGDQTHQGRHVRIPAGQFQCQHFKLYRY